MKTNLITASKALQIMKDSSSIDKIMDAIKKSAAEGYGYVICSCTSIKGLGIPTRIRLLYCSREISGEGI